MPYTAKPDLPELSIVKALLNVPEDSIDFAIERLIDPTVNQIETLHQLKLLADATKARLPSSQPFLVWQKSRSCMAGVELTQTVSAMPWPTIDFFFKG
jgi:hypothetical protein